MSTRAKLTVTALNETTEHSINLGAEKDTLPRHRDDFLLRAAATEIIPAALSRIYGRKTTFVITDEPKYSDKGQTFTVKGLVINPLHGRNNFFEQKVDGKVTLTFSLPGALVEG